VQVLRLLETFSLAEVTAGIRQALRLPAVSFDAIKHLVLCALRDFDQPANRGNNAKLDPSSVDRISS